MLRHVLTRGYADTGAARHTRAGGPGGVDAARVAPARGAFVCEIGRGAAAVSRRGAASPGWHGAVGRLCGRAAVAGCVVGSLRRVKRPAKATTETRVALIRTRSKHTTSTTTV